jgi:hypothetical protein
MATSRMTQNSMKWTKRTAAIAVIGTLVSACGGSSTGSQQTPAAEVSEASTTVALVPLEEVQAAQDAARTIYGTVGGDPVTINGYNFAVVSIDDAADQDGTRVLPVEVRVENPSTSSVNAPDLKLICADNDDVFYYMAGSTYPPQDRTMPAGTFAEGLIRMQYPEGCDDAFVEVSPLMSTNRTPIVRFIVDTSATPPPAPTTSLVEVEGEIETPAEAAAALIAAGITCDRYLDSSPSEVAFGPTTLDGSCENGDLEISISVFESDASDMMDLLLPAYGELFKSFGIEATSVVNDDKVSYGVQSLDGNLESVPSEPIIDLLNEIADATGGDLETYEF